MTGFLRGCATALVTPFKENEINFDALGALLDRQCNGGADAVVVLGTTGEPATLDEGERERVVAYARERLAGRALLIVGTGGNCTKHAVRETERAYRLGADGVLAVTPYYNKCTQRGLFEYYRALSEASPLPFLCYNVPARTGVNLLPETMARIAELPNAAGIKEASGNMAQILETARLIRGKCDLVSGDDALNLPILCAGGTAVVSVLSNLVPERVKALYGAVRAGNLELANDINDALLPLIRACFSEVNPIPVKEGLNLLGFGAGIPRPPLTPLEPAHRDLLIGAMRACGLEVRA